MKIVGIRKRVDIDIQFIDDFNYVKEHVNYQNFLKGQIKNPYDKTVYGIGYLGSGRYKTWNKGKFTTEYNSWSDMISRCYADEKGQPAYFNRCTVCDDWLNFQVFCSWYNENAYKVNERLHLDKDILFPGNKIYSPKKCLLVPQRINMLFVNIPNKRGLPNGISRTKHGFSAKYNQTELGVFSTIEEAFFYYAIEKEKKIKEVAKEYENVIPKKVYDALFEYKVNIEYDKNYKVS